MLVAAGAALFAAGGIVSYGAMSPTSQLFGETVAHVAKDRIALTFDDGPNGDTTLRLLDVLAAAGVRATFFLIGRYVRQQSEIARAIHAAGHAIGNHTDTHPSLFWCSPKRVERELTSALHSIEDAIGAQVTIFRPPFGARRPDVLQTARSLGLAPILWNVTCYDWKPTTPERVLAHAERQMRGNAAHDRGSILLLHDGGHVAPHADRAHTIAAVKRMVAQHTAAEFVTLASTSAATR